MDATRAWADRCNDLGPGGLFARTDRRAARAHPQGRDGGLWALGQIPPSARNGDGRRAVAARDVERHPRREAGSRTARRLIPATDTQVNNTKGAAANRPFFRAQKPADASARW